MANKNLVGVDFDVPKIVLDKLIKIRSTFSENDKSRYFRISDIIEKKVISYEQMKRIKNFFDVTNQNDKPEEYIKNGGDALKNWVNEALNNARDSDKKLKHDKSEYAGMSNQYAKEHENGVTLNRDYLLNKLKIQEIIKRLE